MKQGVIGAYIGIVVAVILWGLSFIWTNNLIHADIPVFTFIFFRMAIAGTLLFIFSSIRGKLQKIDKKDLTWFFLFVFCSPFIYFIAETYGLKATNSPILSSLIIALIPVAALFADRIFFQSEITWRKLIGVFMTLPGVALMVLQQGNLTPDYWWGVLLLFIAVLAAAGYNVIIHRLSAKYNSHTITTFQFLGGAAFFLPFFLSLNGFGTPECFDLNILFSTKLVWSLLALSVLCSCTAFVLFVNANKVIGVTRSSIFNALIPAFSAIGSYIAGYDAFSFVQVFGIALVISGVILAQR